MGIIIRKSGLYTTIQDYGRVGYQEFGFSVCGAMDKRSLKIANILVGNPVDEAVIEMTLVGPTIEFTESNIIAITGGNLRPKLNGQKVHTYQALLVKSGDVLSFEYAKSGCRAYIAFAGGLKVPKVMGSKSTYVRCGIGGYKGRTLQAGDYIKFESPKDYLPYFLSRKINYMHKNESEVTLRVIRGPQDTAFTENGLKTFFSSPYKVTNENDRMGCRLDGPVIEHKSSADIISDGIALGSIQVPSHGKPIIMMTDRQTTGGYTKIATVISVDIPKLAQRKAGDTIYFKEISLKEAQDLYKEEKLLYKAITKNIHKPCMEVLEPRSASRRIEVLLEKDNNPFQQK
ncbi:biotin-dependent carboxyltransferase family protein [Intestinibacter sp.]|uniref:5-oxoprolinase subunit C family protein n=1 Tax=Intestinibacter sp. TaxID=1965304 RepID=UPI003F191BDF